MGEQTISLASTERRCIFVHCGLHKTGTTALQEVLAEHRDTLAEHGILFPFSGDENAGHHNLAWEIVGDRRFNPQAITMRKLLDTIAGSTSDVVISSEDFESLLTKPDLFRSLINPLRTAGWLVFLIIYERNATDYAESLYIELLQHGYARSFSHYIKRIRKTGELKFQTWIFHFNAERLRAALAQLTEVRVIHRPYDIIKASKSTVADFLSVIGREDILAPHTTSRRVAVRPSFEESVTHFCCAVFGRPLRTQEKSLVGRLCNATHGVRLAAGSAYRLGPGERPRDPTLRLERVCSWPSIAVMKLHGLLSPGYPALCQWLEKALVLWWAGARPVA